MPSCFTFNPFPHIDAFWRLCSRQLFENIVTKEEIAQNEQFLRLPQCFPVLVISYPFNYRDFLLFDKICSMSSAAELSYRERVKIDVELTSLAGFLKYLHSSLRGKKAMKFALCPKSPWWKVNGKQAINWFQEHGDLCLLMIFVAIGWQSPQCYQNNNNEKKII